MSYLSTMRFGMSDFCVKTNIVVELDFICSRLVLRHGAPNVPSSIYNYAYFKREQIKTGSTTFFAFTIETHQKNNQVSSCSTQKALGL